METTNWRIIKKVIEHGNLTDASVDLNISQSGISYTIKKIEQEVGFPIFIRHSKGMSLTTNGKELLPFIDTFLENEVTFSNALLKINSMASGNLIIGTYKSISKHWLPKILELFIQDYPKVKINIQQGSSERLEKKLQDNSIVFALTSYRDRPEFEWIDLKQDQLLVVLPLNHNLANKSVIDLNTLQKTKFIGSSNDYEYDVNRILREKNITSNHVTLFTNDEETILQMVRQGLGIGLLFNSYLKENASYDIVIKETSPPLYRRLGVAVRPAELKLPIIKKFIDYSEEIMN